LEQLLRFINEDNNLDLKGLSKLLPTVIVTWSAGEGVEQGTKSGKLEEEGVDHRMNNTASGKKNFRYLKLKRQF
jgi:hypothetical protein